MLAWKPTIIISRVNRTQYYAHAYVGKKYLYTTPVKETCSRMHMK